MRHDCVGRSPSEKGLHANQPDCSDCHVSNLSLAHSLEEVGLADNSHRDKAEREKEEDALKFPAHPQERISSCEKLTEWPVHGA